MANTRLKLQVSGIVQGVGFRPFVYGLATRLGLAGFVRNDSSGVLIEIEGPPAAVHQFAARLKLDQPPAAAIESVESELVVVRNESAFHIEDSRVLAGRSTPIPSDLATCADCLRELLDPRDRRYRYPFINCTNCGPRFTIIRAIPYDRPATTMAAFPMCADCDREYHDPANRRFHAQPNACPACGPSLTYEPGEARGEAALAAARSAIANGKIVAVKGIGGFHLACDATNARAIAELRRRKGRGDKPLAVMAADLDIVRRYALADEGEAALLESIERPIVLLTRREVDTSLADAVAPGHTQLGFLLPYSPLHHLLVADGPLVMTSGNRADEPIARTNEEARERLDSLADGFLLHDREIHTVCDDSVIRVFHGRALPVRRSRGYAPVPVLLPHATGNTLNILAVGGELKSTFSLTSGRRAYLSQHIGDMENIETLEAFERAATHLQSLLRITPQVIACDLHPGYMSTVWARRHAQRLGLPVVAVQHHHAHVAGLMAEHGLDRDTRVIGVSFDGTGLGTDGAVWGGELLACGYADFERLGQLKYVPVPGGDAAVKRPYRMALAHCMAAGIEWTRDLPPVTAAADAELKVLKTQLTRRLASPDTSSMGRLFDAAASLLGIRHVASYEAQGAMELEAFATRAAHSSESYEFEIHQNTSPMLFDPTALWRRFVGDLRSGVAREEIAVRFHRAVANLILQACRCARSSTGIETVALTGGVFQNVLLLDFAMQSLCGAGFMVLTHRATPPNDGGLSLGQAAVALASTIK